MTDHLVTTIENRRSGARLIRFAGVLDEHNRLGEIAESVGAGMALINLAGIERINSKGVRDWISWLSSLHDKGTRPVLIAWDTMPHAGRPSAGGRPFSSCCDASERIRACSALTNSNTTSGGTGIEASGP